VSSRTATHTVASFAAVDTQDPHGDCVEPPPLHTLRLGPLWPNCLVARSWWSISFFLWWSISFFLWWSISFFPRWSISFFLCPAVRGGARQCHALKSYFFYIALLTKILRHIGAHGSGAWDLWLRSLGFMVAELGAHGSVPCVPCVPCAFRACSARKHMNRI